MPRASVVERAYGWWTAHPLVLDVVLAALLMLASAALTAPGLREVLLSAALVAPLLLRRTHPLVSTAAVAAAALLTVIATGVVLAADAAVLVSVYSLAAYGSRAASRGGLALALAGAVLLALRSFPVDLFSTAFVTGLLMATAVGAWALGDLRRVRAQQVDALTERARMLELEREQEARLAAVAERTRIAREMHDVVAHSLSVVVVQADGGRYAASADPEAAVRSLETIAATARQALTDMRGLLGVLRADDADGFSPQPGAAAIPALVGELASSGLDVALREFGVRGEVPPGPGLAAYRIVQEALTNVLKHAGPRSRAEVTLVWSPGVLDVRVEDDGRGAGAAVAPSGADRPAGEGQGVLGMRERAALHGGSCSTGARAGGGYVVHAVLPYGRAL